jgi:hypothetical protein
MNTYLVTLADRNTGKDQRILVQSEDDVKMQEFVESDEVRPALLVADPVVIAIHQLRIKRPPPKITIPSLIRR